jgi:DNA-binding FadR family transcriptional regulator
VQNNTAASDHDLLIRIDTKVDVLQSTVQETRTALSARIDRLAQEKAGYSDLDPLRKAIERFQEDVTGKINKADFDDLLHKVDGTRRLLYIGVGVLLTLQFLAPFVWAKLLH